MVLAPKPLLEKTFRRISESKWTKLFILTSILQAILVMVLEGRVYAHNGKVRTFLREHDRGGSSECDVSNSTARLGNIMQENLVFMGFQAFQFLFCVNAIYNQNTIQMITIAVINYCCALFGIVQILETVKWRNTLDDELAECPDKSVIEAQTISFEVPLVVILLIFGTALGFLAFKLYKQFGWNIYKRIGADLRMQTIYRTMLIFVMLLKLDLFFMLAFSILALFVFDVEPKDLNRTELSRGSYYFHFGMTLLIVIMQVLAYLSLRKEWASGTIIFIIFCVVSIIDYLILLKNSITTSVQTTWFFWVFFILISCVLTALTAIWAFLVYRNFGNGLKALLDRGKREDHNNNNLGMSNQGIPHERWVIEEDED